MRANFICCVLSLLAFQPATCFSADDVATNGDAANAAAKERDQYELMKLFVETFQQIENNYVKEIDRRQLMESAIRGMLSDLDQYSNFIPPREVGRFNQMVEQEFGGIGITVNVRGGQLIVVSPLPGTPAYRAGIRAGDAIVEVEGEPTEGYSLSDAIQKLQGPVGRPVKLAVQHVGDESGPVSMEIVRELIKAPTVRGERYDKDDQWDYMLQTEPNIGYIRMTHFSRHTTEEIKAAMDKLVEQKVEGVILDLRFNPGGLLEAAIGISDMFLEEGTIVSVRGRNVPERSWSASKPDTYPNMPMAILVNAYSASASEVLSACLQDNNRAVVIGERTWGKGSVQNVIRMEDGESALKLTTASYHRPSGVNIHRFPRMKPSEQWGVSPDEGFLIPYTSADWSAWDAGRSERDIVRPHTEQEENAAEEGEATFDDRQLTAAVNYIKQKLAAKSDTAAE
ncbi:MAG: S41 family peptidase [Fuerstiella sp.]